MTGHKQEGLVMSKYEEHIRLVEAVNQSKTTEEHMKNSLKLEDFRDAYRDDPEFGRMLMDCDRYYLDQGIDRPMCCGVFLECNLDD